MMPVRLLIVDDQATIRDALAVMLDLDPDIDVIGTASDGKQAIERVREHIPDVVLMDLNMPIMGGIEATRVMHVEWPTMPIVILTTFEDDQSILGALRAGARGYLTKDADRATIVQAVRSAHAGHGVLDPDVRLRLLDLASRRPSQTPSPTLTVREREILALIGEGLRNTAIAARLTVSEATVKTHINNIFAKADLHSRADAVRLVLTINGSSGLGPQP